MSLIKVRPSTRNRYYDPFGFARDLLTWDAPNRSGSEFRAHFDVKEDESSFILTADVPGVSKDDIEISLDNDVLTIAGSRNAEDKREGESYYVYERRHGRFERTFRLPKHASSEGIAADLKDGVLQVTIPKRAEARPKKITVK